MLDREGGGGKEEVAVVITGCRSGNRPDLLGVACQGTEPLGGSDSPGRLWIHFMCLHTCRADDVHQAGTDKPIGGYGKEVGENRKR